MSRDRLFCGGDFSRGLENHLRKMDTELLEMEGNRFLNTGIDTLVEYCVNKYTVTPPTLRESEIKLSDHEARIDISRNFNYDSHRSSHRTGLEIRMHVPFEGDGELFQVIPSTRNFNPPIGEVQGTELVLSVQTLEHDAARVKTELDKTLGDVKQYLGWVSNQAKAHNSGLASRAREIITSRREKLLKDKQMVASLGYPLRQRNDAPQTYVPAEVRKKLVPKLPTASSAPFTPEPRLETEHYEHILKTLNNMVLVMERSPAAFAGMSEEHLRQHFLVQLNGQYEGAATGETFNATGKTDILLRHEGKNLFIAECKFWTGPKSVTEALDQLLSYATWRDGKLALVVFNHNKGFSAVVAKMKEAVKAHPNFVREQAYKSETGYRCVMHHKDDKSRELLLTVLAFEVPSGGSA